MLAQKVYHKAKFIHEGGAVSALCFSTPRPINLRINSWTNRDSAVTCKKCLKVLAASVFEIERDPKIKDQAWFDFLGRSDRIIALMSKHID